MSNRLYNILTFLTLPFVKYQLQKRYGSTYVRQRLDGNNVPSGSFDVLVHAASVGEQQLVRPVLEALSAAGKRILLTAATDTGLARAMLVAEKLEGLTAGYMPLDRPGPMRAFFDRVQTEKLVLVETEIWPNLITMAKQRQIEIVLINGRLSDDSVQKYRRFRFLFGNIFGSIDRCLVRSSEDAARFRQLGVREDRIRVTGNLKLCQRPEAEPVVIETDKPVVVFGSTREQEESLILEAASDLFREGHLIPVFAPRHPARCETVEQEMREAGLNVITSRDRDHFQPGSASAILVNETGRLNSFYHRAGLCYVGGALVPKGGQNFVEPMYFGKPVVTGTHLDNFRDLIPEFSDVLTMVNNIRELRFVLDRFCEQPDAFQELGEKGRKRLEADQDALARTMEVLI